MEGNFQGQRGLARFWKQNLEVQTMQVIKMMTHILIEKTCNKVTYAMFWDARTSPIQQTELNLRMDFRLVQPKSHSF
jgi:hypothetical protein